MKKTSLIRNKAVNRTFLLVGLLAGLNLFSGCWLHESWVRVRQVRTVTLMQSIGHKIERLHEEGDELTRERVLPIIKSVNNGLDAWGNEFFFDVRSSGERSDYILVSFGSDGKPDVSNVDGYYRKEKEHVHSKGKRDIIFRNGKPITFAGK